MTNKEITINEERTPIIPGDLWAELADKSKWTPEQKVHAVIAYVNHGYFKRASKATGIPRQTIQGWAKESWWLKVTDCIYNMKSQKIASLYVNTIEHGAEQLLDRTKNGEYVYDKSGNMQYEENEDGEQKLDDDGNPVPKRKKLTAHSLAIDTIAIPQDKLAVLKGSTVNTKKDAALEHLMELSKLLHEVGVQALKKDNERHETIEHDNRI